MWEWMTMDRLDVLLHPVRIRIVNSFSGGRTRTTSELCARLPQVSQATVYRQVGVLAAAGVLQVIDERHVRGAVERRYRLDRELAMIDQDAAARMALDDHRRAFTAAMAALIAEFSSYIDRPDSDPSRDLVGYRQIPLWLSPAELASVIDQFQAVIGPLIANPPARNRRQFLLSPILFPVAEGPIGEPAGDGQIGPS
jgi:hypothetical protein